jgi:Uma2 family endonuclease
MTTMPAGTAAQLVRRKKDVVYTWFQSGTWTEEAYMALPETNQLCELTEGRLIILDMPTRQHQEIVGNAYLALRAWAKAGNRGHVLVAPYPIRLWPGKIREPDIVLYTAAHADRAQERQGGAPDLVVEVLSPGTRSTDVGDKFEEYARAGISEYWLLDAENNLVQVYTLQGTRYTAAGSYGPDAAACSTLLSDFSVSVAELFAS